MAPARDAFRERLRAFSHEEALAFLADLYAAQGWTVDRRDGRLEVRRPADDSARTVVLASGSSRDVSDADVVVRVGRQSDVEPPDGATVLDSADLYDRVRYGVDSDAGERLLGLHFGDLPDRGARPTGSDAPSTDTGAELDRSTAEPPATADEPPEPTADASDRGRAGYARRSLLLAAGAILGGAGTLLATRLTGRGTAVRAPGVTAAGIEDPGALASAHATAISSRSYSLGLDYVRRDGDLAIRSSFALDLALTADRAFLASVSTDGPDAPLVLGEPPAQSRFYSDGERHYVDHAPDEDEGALAFDPPRGFVGTWEYWAYLFTFGGVLGSSPETYYRGLFESVPTRLVDVQEAADGERYRLLSTTATPQGSVGDFTGRDVGAVDLSAVVDQTGVVRGLDLGFRSIVEGTPSRVRRRIGYSDLGETTVTRPDWAT